MRKHPTRKALVADGPIRTLLRSAALLAAGFVCLQIGFVELERKEQTSALETELADLRALRASEIEGLRSKLERTERTAKRLRNELAQAEAARDELDDALRRADSTETRLRDEIGEIAEKRKAERPAVDVSLAAFDASRLLVAGVTNRGADSVEIREAEGGYWVDGAFLPLAGSLAPMLILPGDARDAFEWDADANALELVPGASQPLRGAVCLVFARAGADEQWVEERWFEHHPARGQSAILARESWRLDADTRGCALAELPAPWSP